MKLEHCGRASCVQIIEELSDCTSRATNNALYWHNRCIELEEIIELFCMDAEYHKRASDAISQHFQSSETRVLITPHISNGAIA